MAKMLVMLTLIVFCISGCSVGPKELVRAEELCKPNGGIRYIRVIISADVVCSNGAFFPTIK